MAAKNFQHSSSLSTWTKRNSPLISTVKQLLALNLENHQESAPISTASLLGHMSAWNQTKTKSRTSRYHSESSAGNRLPSTLRKPRKSTLMSPRVESCSMKNFSQEIILLQSWIKHSFLITAWEQWKTLVWWSTGINTFRGMSYFLRSNDKEYSTPSCMRSPTCGSATSSP